jgi:hypothetical protein
VYSAQGRTDSLLIISIAWLCMVASASCDVQFPGLPVAGRGPSQVQKVTKPRMIDVGTKKLGRFGRGSKAIFAGGEPRESSGSASACASGSWA